MEDFVFLCVVGGRFVLPLLIPRFPLPAIIACLVLDAADQSIFQAFGYDPPGYQSYDKAMDIFYLAIAYLATMRNWENLGAYKIARFLFFYRLVGAFIFEMTHVRAILLIFPNTFEYFFIAYEAIRTRWSPITYLTRWWIWLAAIIWIFVKLPQEWWLHIAELDVTDTLEEYWWAWPLMIAGIVAIIAFLWFVARPELGATTHTWQIESGPVPADVDTAAKLAALQIKGGWVLSWMTLEKVVLVGLVSVIYAQILPGFDQSTLRTFVSVGVLIVVNAAITVAFSRREWTFESAGLAVLTRLGTNVVLVLAADRLLGNGAAGWDTFFFLCLISLVTTLHDRYQPVLAHRESEAAAVRPA
jgi:hypothetical protein